MTARAPKPRAARAPRTPKAPRATKSDATRARVLAKALALFQKRGVEATTMRDIAEAAGLSLGAAYYYFPSKEALVFAYYEDNQAQMEQLARAIAPSASLRERLGAIFHGKLASVAPQRAMLATIVHRLADPADDISAFSAQSRAIRTRAIAILADAIAPAHLPADLAHLAASALWLLLLAALLVFVHDPTPDQQRTHQLVDDALDLAVPLLPLVATPYGRAIGDRLIAALARAQLFTA